MPSLGYHAYKSKAKYEIWQKWQKHPLNVELKIIRGRVANECIANLFAETVRRLVEKSSAFKSTEKPSTELDPIKDIVLRVKDQIFALDDDDDESYLRCGEILLDGMKDLKVLMAHKRSPKKLAKLEEEESEAIWQDQRRYESILCQSAPLPSSNPNIPIRIFFMEDPNKEPYLLKQDRLMTTYNDIIWYLNIHKIVQAPELWVRREDPNVQPYTSSGRHWVFVSGVESINETVLDTVEMTSVSDSYIVALVDNGEQEKPVPIDVPIFGKRTCCNPSCGSLHAHLKSLWTDVLVEHARLFRSQNHDRVLEIALDNRNFPLRRNELYLKVAKRMEEDSNAANSGL